MKNALAFAGVFVALLVTASAVAKPGTFKKIGKKDWAAVHGITAHGNKLYVASGLTLLVSDATGKATDLYAKRTPDWSAPKLLTALDDKLYVIAAGKLYEVDPKSGKQKNLEGHYRYPGGIVGLDGKLYLASDDALWAVDKSNGKNVKLTDRDWYNVKAVAALDGKLYVMTNSELFEVDTAGSYKPIYGTFANTNGMVGANGKLYIFAGDPQPVLHQIDKTGKDTTLPLPKDWDGTTGIVGMTALNDKLFLLEPQMGSTVVLFSVDAK